MSLPERLHAILVTLRESFGVDLPDPGTLPHTGEVTIRGQTFTTSSSAPLDEFAQENKFTVYLHTLGQDGENEMLHYSHFEGRREMSAVYIRLKMVDGKLQQHVTLSSLPREIFVQMVERRLGRGPPRERRERRGGQRPKMNFNNRPPPLQRRDDDSPARGEEEFEE